MNKENLFLKNKKIKLKYIFLLAIIFTSYCAHSSVDEMNIEKEVSLQSIISMDKENSTNSSDSDEDNDLRKEVLKYISQVNLDFLIFYTDKQYAKQNERSFLRECEKYNFITLQDKTPLKIINIDAVNDLGTVIGRGGDEIDRLHAFCCFYKELQFLLIERQGNSKSSSFNNNKNNFLLNSARFDESGMGKFKCSILRCDNKKTFRGKGIGLTDNDHTIYIDIHKKGNKVIEIIQRINLVNTKNTEESIIFKKPSNIRKFNPNFISSDGSTVVGHAQIASNDQFLMCAYMWKPESNTSRILSKTKSSAISTSRNGNFVVGEDYSDNPDIPNACLWTVENDTISFKRLMDPKLESIALGVNDDGSKIVGYYKKNNEARNTAFIWTRSGEVHILEDILHKMGKLPLNCYLTEATAISDNGVYIAGNGILDNNPIGWRAILPREL